MKTYYDVNVTYLGYDPALDKHILKTAQKVGKSRITGSGMMLYGLERDVTVTAKSYKSAVKMARKIRNLSRVSSARVITTKM